MSDSSVVEVQTKTAALRIMHVVLTMDFGGTEQVVRQIVRGVDPGRYQSSIVCIDGHIGEIGNQLQADGTPIHILSRGTGFDRKTIGRLRQLIREQGIDVLHCHQYTPFCYGSLACVGLPTKVIFTEHGRFYPDSFTWKRRLVNQLLYRLVDEITCISKATRHALNHYEWIPSRKVKVIYNGVETPTCCAPAGSVRQTLGINDNAYVLGTISRLDPIKNQRMMVEALAELRGRIENCVLIVAGDGPERQSLEALAKNRGVADAVYFVGFITDIGDYLSAMDVFLLTSFSEGTSMTLLEAMSMRKPIVATRVGGNSEVLVSGKTGLLIESDDRPALITALNNLRSDSELRKKISCNAQVEFQEKFSRKTMSVAYTSLYNSLVTR